MAATAYNLKKLLKYRFKPVQENIKQLKTLLNNGITALLNIISRQYDHALTLQF